jgi:hypothetical protein
VYFDSRPVGPGIGQHGAASHIYYYISPESGSAFSNIGAFTLGAVPGGGFGTGNVTPTFGALGSNADSRAGLSNARQIIIPQGKTEDDLIKALYMGNVAVANAGAKYSAVGGYNSNSYARTLAQFGGILGQFNSYASQFYIGSVNTAPGSNRSVPLGSAGSMGIGNTQGKFVGTYDFGAAGTYNFGTQSWVTPSPKK